MKFGFDNDFVNIILLDRITINDIDIIYNCFMKSNNILSILIVWSIWVIGTLSKRGGYWKIIYKLILFNHIIIK